MSEERFDPFARLVSRVEELEVRWKPDGSPPVSLEVELMIRLEDLEGKLELLEAGWKTH